MVDGLWLTGDVDRPAVGGITRRKVVRVQGSVVQDLQVLVYLGSDAEKVRRGEFWRSCDIVAAVSYRG